MAKKKPKNKKYLNHRKWLNRADHEYNHSSVIANVDRRGESIDASFSLSDCSRRVDLQFEMYGYMADPAGRKAEIHRMLEKIAKLREAVEAFEAAYIAAAADSEPFYEESRKEYLKRKAERRKERKKGGGAATDLLDL